MQKGNPPYDHTIFMKRCLELAEGGLGQVSPNPMVGAVIVCNGRIIGEGFHRMFGEAHAEVNAIQAVGDEKLFQKSTLYVNLEPCSHLGKTPPCSDLIIQKGIPEVVIGTVDPNSLVAGKGIRKLRGAGIRVITDVLREQCLELNKRFFTFHEKKRPYIILKWAQTRDGFIDKQREPGSPVGINWITSNRARILVHKWRSEEKGILIGTNSVIKDDPRLNLRLWKGINPVRIILDRNLRIPRRMNIYDDSSPTLIFNRKISKKIGQQTEYVKTDFGPDDLSGILNNLYEREINSIIVEGGRKVLDSFIQSENWDEARVFIGKREFGKGVRAPIIPQDVLQELDISGDRLLIYRA